MASHDPGAHVLIPGTPLFRSQSAVDEIVDVAFERVAVVNLAVLSLKVVIGEHDIPRVADDVNDSPVAMIKIVVSLNDARARCAFECSIGLVRGVGNEPLDVGEPYLRIRVKQIGYQESGPEVSRARIRDHERVIRIDAEIAPSSIGTEQIGENNFYSVDHGISEYRNGGTVEKLSRPWGSPFWCKPLVLSGKLPRGNGNHPSASA